MTRCSSPFGAPRNPEWRLTGAAESVSYKILYHVGEEISIKTKTAVGRLSLENGCLVIRGEPAVSIDLGALRSVELFRLHGMGRMLKVVHTEGVSSSR